MVQGDFVCRYSTAVLFAVVVIDADHDGRRLDDGVCIAADCEPELLDGAESDGRTDDVAALELNADDAVDGALFDRYNLALELVSCTQFHKKFPP